MPRRDTAYDELFPTLGRRVAEDERQVLGQLSTKQLCGLILPHPIIDPSNLSVFAFMLRPSRLVCWCLTPSARLDSRKKARESGISDEAIEEANDTGDSAEQKSAFIALLLDA